MVGEKATLSVANTRSVPVTFCLEPFGATSLMPPGSTWTVTAQLAEGDHLTVAMDDGAIVVQAGESLYTPVTVTQGEAVVMDYSLPDAALFDPYKSLRPLGRA
jgi:hypothetical protein